MCRFLEKLGKKTLSDLDIRGRVSIKNSNQNWLHYSRVSLSWDSVAPWLYYISLSYLCEVFVVQNFIAINSRLWQSVTIGLPLDRDKMCMWFLAQYSSCSMVRASSLFLWVTFPHRNWLRLLFTSYDRVSVRALHRLNLLKVSTRKPPAASKRGRRLGALRVGSSFGPVRSVGQWGRGSWGG